MADARDRRGETPHTSFRLPATERRILAVLADQLGLTRTKVMMLALRQLARREGVPLKAERPPLPAAPEEATPNV
jgi:antitoxin component of RelBE/YafQ-DinJ toxin-antitoxin module